MIVMVKNFDSQQQSYTFYAPNFEKVGSILLLARPFVCLFVLLSVCAFVHPFKKNLKLGF